MLTLSATLTAHQQSARRVPRLSASVSSDRNGFRILSWERQVQTALEPDDPHGIAVAGAHILRVRNNAGSVKVSRLAYPLSGGFKDWSLLSAGSARWLLRIERALEPMFGRLFGFRMMIVIEKR